MVSGEDHMRRALFHAARGEGVTTPNPMVGAVVVTPDGIVAGYGRHPRAGEPHAEVFALNDAGDRARGAVLYVTLEPCCHVGRTGPCTTRIIDAGIRRVVAAMRDPNPLVSGRGFDALRAAGIEVDVGLLEDEAARLNRAFTIVQTLGRPMVIAKVATSKDGKIASAPGQRTALTSEPANRRTQRLRAAVDAIGVGAGTVIIDDPVLTVRGVYRLRPLTRVVFDRRLRVSPQARLFSTLDTGPVVVMTTAAAVSSAPEKVAALKNAGATIVESSGVLADDLRALIRFDVSTLLLEGGAALHAAAWQAGLIDRLHTIVTPAILGEGSVPSFGGIQIPETELTTVRFEQLGPDHWMEADVHRHR